MDDDMLHDAEPTVGRGRGWWPERAKDWRLILLTLAILAGLGFAYRQVTKPPGPIKVSPEGKQVATQFVHSLLVQHDCRAAAKFLDYSNDQTDGPPPSLDEGLPPRTNDGCARYIWVSKHLDARQDLWYVVRDTGAIVPNCAFRGGLSVRYGVAPVEDSQEDDCVSFRLIARKSWGLLSGHLDVNAHRRHGKWLVTSFFASPSQGAAGFDGSGCHPNCLALWKKRANAQPPGSAHRLTMTLSTTHGPPGTRVVVRVRNCARPFVQSEPLAWYEHNGSDDGRPIAITRTSRRTVSGIFTVRKSDNRGVGFLQFLCGAALAGPSSSATANFAVTP
jgi:hypothetical protein